MLRTRYFLNKLCLFSVVFLAAIQTRAAGALDWSVEGYTQLSLSEVYPALGTPPVQLTVNVTGDLTSVEDISASDPEMNQNYLQICADHQFDTETLTITYDFDNAVSNFTSGIRDVDRNVGGNWVDLITITGIDQDGNVVYPIITPQTPANTYEVIDYNGDGNFNSARGLTSTSINTNTPYTFASAVTQVTLVYGHDPAQTTNDPSSQCLWLDDLAWEIVADLGVSKDDFTTTFTPGDSFSYTIVVDNSGPADVSGATITDPLPAWATGATWTCTATGGAVCPNATGTGSINESITTFPYLGELTYTLSGTYSSDDSVY